MNYPDKPAPAGTQLVPEVAQSLPVISDGGRTYTFTIRKGFRFSPPSKEPVTAQSFKYAIERTLSPKMHSPAGGYMDDVVGAKAYKAGKAAHIAGVIAKGDTLTIRLTRPNGDLPARLTMPFFCAVPPGTPIDPKGVPAIPSAGPYYIASYTPKQQVVLKRNPNYRGTRPRRFEQIVYSLGGSAQPDVRRVKSGQADYDPDPDDLPPQALAGLVARYGSGSAAAQAGRQQLYIASIPGIRYLVLNTSRGLFADVNLRKAANYAVDRPALLRYPTYGGTGEPLDHYLPPDVPGYRATHIYPLEHPDLATARRLASGRGGHALMYTCDKIKCLNEAQVVKHDLAAIGIDVEIKQFPWGVLYEKLARPGEPWDIVNGPAWVVDWPDPLTFLVPLFDGSHIKEKSNSDFSLLDNPSINRRLGAATRLTGPERYRVAGQLDLELAQNEAPFIAYASWATYDFFSLRIGCHVVNPTYGMDLGALCVRR